MISLNAEDLRKIDLCNNLQVRAPNFDDYNTILGCERLPQREIWEEQPPAAWEY